MREKEGEEKEKGRKREGEGLTSMIPSCTKYDIAVLAMKNLFHFSLPSFLRRCNQRAI